MLSAIGIAVGLGLSMIGLCDLFLSRAQKESFNILAAALWNEADEIRKLSFSHRLTHPAISRTAIGLTGVLLVPGFFNTMREGDSLLAVIGFSAFLFSVWIGPYVLAWVAKSKLRSRMLIAAAVSAVIGGFSISRVVGFAVFMMTAYYLVVKAMYFVVLYICAACVAGVEVILRRVAEYPKGAVAAVGIILTFISACIKFLSNPSPV